MPAIIVPFSSKNKWIPLFFIHVPKCGGSSLENAFLNSGCELCMHDRFDRKENSLLSRIVIHKCPTQHFHLEMLEPILNLSNFSQVFAIIRNPFSRLASEFRFLRGNTGMGTSEDAIDKWLPIVMKQYQKDPFWLHNHLRPQVEFTDNSLVKVYKLENGMKAVFQDILSKLSKVEDWTPRELSSDKIILTQDNATLKNNHSSRDKCEQILRNNSYLSALVRDIYADDFRKYYPLDSSS